jgi:hypothetical protein
VDLIRSDTPSFENRRTGNGQPFMEATGAAKALLDLLSESRISPNLLKLIRGQLVKPRLKLPAPHRWNSSWSINPPQQVTIDDFP